jgi:hypothetical protein
LLLVLLHRSFVKADIPQAEVPLLTGLSQKPIAPLDAKSPMSFLSGSLHRVGALQVAAFTTSYHS